MSAETFPIPSPPEMVVLQACCVATTCLLRGCCMAAVWLLSGAVWLLRGCHVAAACGGEIEWAYNSSQGDIQKLKGLHHCLLSYSLYRRSLTPFCLYSHGCGFPRSLNISWMLYLVVLCLAVGLLNFVVLKKLVLQFWEFAKCYFFNNFLFSIFTVSSFQSFLLFRSWTIQNEPLSFKSLISCFPFLLLCFLIFLLNFFCPCFLNIHCNVLFLLMGQHLKIFLEMLVIIPQLFAQLSAQDGLCVLLAPFSRVCFGFCLPCRRFYPNDDPWLFFLV